MVTAPILPQSRRWFLNGLGRVAGLAALSARSWGSEPKDATAAGDLQEFKRTGRALGADAAMTVLHTRRNAAEKALDAAFKELGELDGILSLYRRDSEICRLNREGALEDPDARFVEVARQALAASERSGGAFDITVQPLWELYAAAKKAGRLPTAIEVEEARSKVDWRKVEVSPRRIRLKERGMAMTLNAIAQGYAADRVVAVLREHGIEHALVNTGEIGALGGKQGGQPWTVGIQHPRHPDAYIALVELKDTFLATSGDYETSFSKDYAYNHIFNPATGRSPAVFSSVTVVARGGAEADALATAVFVMGLEKGLKLVKETPGAEAFLVLKDGRVLGTEGFPRA